VTCCRRQSDGDAPGGGGAGEPLEFELDFTAQGTRSLATGPEVLNTTDGDPLAWTVALFPGSAGPVPDTLDVSPAGLVWGKGDGSTSWSTSSPTSGTRMFLPLAQVFALFDSDVSWAYRVDAYGTDFSFTSTGAFVCGLWGDNGSPSNAANRLAGAGRALQAGIPVWRPIAAGTAPNYTTAPGPTTDVSGFLVVANSVAVHAGTWPGSWAALRRRIMWNCGYCGNATESDPMMGEQNSIALGFSQLGSTPTADLVTIERMRVQAIPMLPY
jgi:hypothetical protein